jgi:DNA-binding transcriptional regulator YiaG
LGKPMIFDLDSVPFITIVHRSHEPLEVVDEHATMSAQRPESRSSGMLSQDQLELVTIKEELGVRHQDYAVMLGIGVHRLSSYTYGRTASVPHDVMHRARQLRIENSKFRAATVARFSKPMADILADWSTQLGSQSNDEIAQYIGVTAMTVYRWKKNESRPDLTALCRYDRIIMKIAERMRNVGVKSKQKKAARESPRAISRR